MTVSLPKDDNNMNSQRLEFDSLFGVTVAIFFSKIGNA